MVWSLDFNLSALTVCIIFLLYYCLGKNLPIRRNRLFLYVLLIQFLLTVSDISASVLSSFPQIYNHNIIILSNMIYYMLLALCPFSFTIFTYFLIVNNKANKAIITLIHIPVFIAWIILAFNPFTGFIFYLDSAGTFNYGIGRPTFYFETLFYMLLSMFMILYNPLHLLRRKHSSVLIFYILTTCISHTLQVYVMPYKQVISLGAVAGVTAIFLAFQHPDYYRDRKTGLYNTRGFQLLKEEEFYKHKQTAFIGFEITNYAYFKFSDSDALITEILRRISAYLRLRFKKDTIFYYQNGIFIIALKRPISPMIYKDILLERFAKPFYHDKGSITFDLCFFYDDGSIVYSDFKDLQDSIYIALDMAEKGSKGKCVKITDEIRAMANKRRNIESALKRALDNTDNMKVYYQPIYSVSENKICAAEALVRIEDPILGLIYPDEFIYLAEMNGSIVRLGYIVFAKVCQMLNQYDISKYGIKNIKINVSPYQCMYRNLASDFISIMKKYDIDPSYIGLEITETETSDKTVIHNNIEILLKYGVEFSLDDYGTGYSNLINILKIPFDIVKIDKSICWDYFKGGNTLLEEVITQFNHRNKEVVVEGVEDEEMAKTLSKMNVQFEQGFYFSEPLPLEDFIEYIESDVAMRSQTVIK
ncbi:MAG: EAL domain-containing protein [Butyrivibrio sp.]|nr:EAL domain-containing protein [Butyrivibrio sp.]